MSAVEIPLLKMTTIMVLTVAKITVALTVATILYDINNNNYKNSIETTIIIVFIVIINSSNRNSNAPSYYLLHKT